jgi:hypothetical protein
MRFNPTLGYPGEGPAQAPHEGEDNPGYRRQGWVVRRRKRRCRARLLGGSRRRAHLQRTGEKISPLGQVNAHARLSAIAVCSRLFHQATLAVTAACQAQLKATVTARPRSGHARSSRRARQEQQQRRRARRAEARTLSPRARWQGASGVAGLPAAYGVPTPEAAETRAPSNLSSPDSLASWRQLLRVWRWRQLRLRASIKSAVAALRQRRRGVSKGKRLRAEAARRELHARWSLARPSVEER